MASNISSKKYLDYDGLTYLANNYIINKKIGTTVGDMLYVSQVNSNIPTYARIAAPSGSDTNGWYILNIERNAGTGNEPPTWTLLSTLLTNVGALTNPMTSEGDIIYGGTPQNGIAAPTRLGLGNTSQILVAFNEQLTQRPYWYYIKWVFGTYDASTNPYTTVNYDSTAGGLALQLPDIQSIPTTGTDSIDSLF